MKPASSSKPDLPGPRAQTGGPARNQTPQTDSPFFVPRVLDFLGGLVHHYRAFWVGLGRLESSVLAQELAGVAVRAPVYVCGLARSGSTLLHEILASHSQVATHRLKDFPMLFTPYWWRRGTAFVKPTEPRERAHRDRILITTDSPDALEEMLWMAFFPRCHDPSVSNLLTAADHNPAFESFYPSHLRKLLLAERAARYAAKANYHIARLPYLLRLFPDARFVIPVRAPETHITSLMRQHRWFSAGQRKHPRALRYMQRSGHFEFGMDRRPMNLGDRERVRAIQQAWAAGEEVRGWARCWDMAYSYLSRLLETDARVRAATQVVRFEDLCDAPAETLRTVLAHCALPDADRLVGQYAPGISRPEYYTSRFAPEERAVIREETAATASRWGY